MSTSKGILVHFTVVVLCAAILNIGFSLVFPFLPLHLSQLGSSTLLIGQVTLAAFTGKLLLQLPGGILVDRKGPYPIALFTMLVQILCYLSMAFLTNPYAFLVIRFVMGGAEAVGNTALLVFLTLRAPKEKIGGTMGMYTMACTLSLALGPVLGGWLYDLTGSAYRSMLWATFASCLALVMLFVLGLSQKSFQSEQKSEKKKKSRLMDQLNMLKQPDYLRPLWILAGTNIISQLVYSYITTFMPIYLKEELHFKTSTIGLLFTINFMIFTLAVPFFGKMMDWYLSSQRSIIWAFLMLLFGFFSLGLVTEEITFFVTYAIEVTGAAWLFIASRRYVTDIFPQESLGTAFALLNTFFSVGGMIGPVLGGVIYDVTPKGMFFLSVLFGIGVLAVYFLLTILLNNRRRKREDPSSN